MYFLNFQFLFIQIYISILIFISIYIWGKGSVSAGMLAKDSILQFA